MGLGIFKLRERREIPDLGGEVSRGHRCRKARTSIVPVANGDIILGRRPLSTIPSWRETKLGKPNYQHEKRQKDLAKKKKQEEKRQRKSAKKDLAAQEGQDQPQREGETVH
jgi:hypothetical protein